MNDRREDFDPPSSRRNAATYRRGKSKDEFQVELDIAIVGNGCEMVPNVPN
jgi:hypothetical protein